MLHSSFVSVPGPDEVARLCDALLLLLSGPLQLKPKSVPVTSPDEDARLCDIDRGLILAKGDLGDFPVPTSLLCSLLLRSNTIFVEARFLSISSPARQAAATAAGKAACVTSCFLLAG